MFRECRENNIFIMVRGIATEARIHSLAPANSFPCTLWNVWTQRCDDVSGCGWWIGDELDTSFWWLNTNNKGIGLCGYPTWKWNKFSQKLIFAAFWSWNEILIIWSRFLWFDCSHKTFNGGIQIRCQFRCLCVDTHSFATQILSFFLCRHINRATRVSLTSEL